MGMIIHCLVNKENLADRVVKDLIRANILKESDEIIYLDTVDIKYAYVIFDNERKAAIKIIHEYLKNLILFHLVVMECGLIFGVMKQC